MPWQLSDPTVPATYTLPIGPGQLDALDRQRKAIVGDDLENSPAVVLREQLAPPTLTLSGTLVAQDQYQQLAMWAAKDYPIQLIDDRGVTTHVLVTEWTPKRARKGAPNDPWHHTWTLKVLVLDLAA